MMSQDKGRKTKMAIKMTTSQKYEYKEARYKAPWDPTTSISAYFTQSRSSRTPSLTEASR